MAGTISVSVAQGHHHISRGDRASGRAGVARANLIISQPGVAAPSRRPQGEGDSRVVFNVLRLFVCSVSGPSCHITEHRPTVYTQLTREIEQSEHPNREESVQCEYECVQLANPLRVSEACRHHHHQGGWPSSRSFMLAPPPFRSIRRAHAPPVTGPPRL